MIAVVRRILSRFKRFVQPIQSDREFDALVSSVQSAQRIVIGPWTAELGSEVLYWIPFLRAALRDITANTEIVVLSRGGSGYWYPATHTNVDLFQMFHESYWSSDLFPRLQAEGLAMKQTRKSALDLFIRDQYDGGLWIHPEVLFSVIKPFLSGNKEAEWVIRFLKFAKSKSELPMQANSRDLDVWSKTINALPPRFVAVRGYARPSITRDQVTQTLRKVLTTEFKDLPIVDLSMGFSVDDHMEVAYDSASTKPLLGVPAHLNLNMQQAIIERAEALVSSYGGTAYLGLMAGVPTHALVGDPRMYVWRHLDVARHLARECGSSITVVQAE